MPEIIEKISAMQKKADIWRNEKQRIHLVPTMGYLHEGHLSLVRRAQNKNARVVVSIFVNPLQFGPKEDFSTYPRDLNKDLDQLARLHVDVIFHPQAVDFYPADFSTYVEVEKLTEGLCGTSRPGHFRGVTTVVTKLLLAVKPHIALFGQKDYQQAAVIRRLVRDLNIDAKIEVAPTIREKDGLAMSSRNVNLNPEERRRAPALYRALLYGREQIEAGRQDAQSIIKEMRHSIERDLSADIDYIHIVDPDTLEELNHIVKPVVIALAVRLSKVRLIDNLSATPAKK